MSLARHHSYKDSGVEWLGNVPTHWEVCALNYRFEVALGKMLDEKRITGEYLAPYLRNVDVQWGRINTEDLPEMDFSGADLDRYSVRSGDLLVCEGGEVGRSAVWQRQLKECFYQKALHRLRPRSGNESAYFFYYVLHAAANLGIFAGSEGKATIAHLTAETFRRHRFPFPPGQEQVSIAVFLDRATGKIDALVGEQRRLIELLKEKRQAVISHAVTKGLNPDAPMKSSGVGWLGKIPAHWQVKRLKHVKALSPNAFVDGPFGSNLKSEHFIEGGDVYVIESNFATQGKLEPSNLKTISSEHFHTIQRSETQAGDIVIAKIGAQFGKAAILPVVDKPAVVSGNSMKLTINNEICCTAWAHWQLMNLKESGEIDLLVNGSAQPALSLGGMNQLVFLLPPLNEQEEIVSFLDREMARLGALTAEAARAINLLQERRTSLISAAVTGEIDVRGLVKTSVA